jgi:hypothetical protein
LENQTHRRPQSGLARFICGIGPALNAVPRRGAALCDAPLIQGRRKQRSRRLEDATISGLRRTTFVALAQVIIAFPGRGAAREWCTADPGSWVSRSLPCDDPGSAAHRFALRRARETVSGGSAPTTLYALVGFRGATMSVTLLSPEGLQCSQESAPNGEKRAAGLSALRLGFGWRGALLPGRAASLTFRLPGPGW